MQQQPVTAPAPSPSEESSELFVIFTAAHHRYAVDHRFVDQMVTPPAPVPVPNCHPAIRGVINLRGSVLGLLDLRVVFGQQSAEAEMEQHLIELDGYEQDHQHWFSELEQCARSGAPFSLPINPCECRFGRWLGRYRASNQHVQSIVARFHDPHERLHAGAKRILQHGRRQEREELDRALSELRQTTLARIGHLFNELREALRGDRREIALVLREEGRSPVAVLVDAVETVDQLDQARGAEGEDVAGMSYALVSCIAKDREGALVTVIDPIRLFDEVHS